MSEINVDSDHLGHKLNYHVACRKGSSLMPRRLNRISNQSTRFSDHELFLNDQVNEEGK